MTIKNKKQFADCVRSLQKDINSQTGTTIKLSVIREALAHALGQKSSNGLLSVLPIPLCTSSLPAELQGSLMELAGVSYKTSLSTFPYPVGLELSKPEIVALIKSATERNLSEDEVTFLLMRVANDDLNYFITGDVSIIPNGDGTWATDDESKLKVLRLLFGDDRVGYIASTGNISANQFKAIYRNLYQPFRECIKSRELWQQVENFIISTLGEENLVFGSGEFFTISPQNFDITVMELLQLNLISIDTGESITQSALYKISVEFINDLLMRKNYATSDFYIENMWKPLLGDKFGSVSGGEYVDVCRDDIWSEESKQAINDLFLAICKDNNWLNHPISSIVTPRFDNDISTTSYRCDLADECYYSKRNINGVKVTSKPYSRSSVLEYIDCQEYVSESDDVEEKIEKIELEYQEDVSMLDGMDEDDAFIYYEDPDDVRSEKLSKLPLPLSVPRIFTVEAKRPGKAIVSGTVFDLSESYGCLSAYIDYLDTFGNDFCFLGNAAKHFDDLDDAESIFVLGRFSYSNINDFKKCLDEIVEFHLVKCIVIDIDFIKDFFPAYPHASFIGLDSILQYKVDEFIRCLESNFEVSEFKLGVQSLDPLFSPGAY